MNNHFTVTITDEYGVKQFNLHKFIKKAFFYTLLFMLTIAFIAVGTILYLDSSVNKLQNKRIHEQKAYEELQEKNSKLSEIVSSVQTELSSKKQELDEVSDSLAEIEELIGLETPKELSLQDRATVTKLNSQQMALLLKFIPSGSPIEYHGITSKFGYRIHPTLHTREFHRGSDMKAEFNTPVHATADGIVEYAGYHKKSGYGNLVIVQHNYGFKTYFGHLRKVTVHAGEFIKKGDLVAYTGSSGLSNGPHLHYEIRFLQRALNPFWFIKWDVKNFKEIFEKEKNIPWQSLVTAVSNIKMNNTTQTTLQLSQLAQK